MLVCSLQHVESILGGVLWTASNWGTGTRASGFSFLVLLEYRCTLIIIDLIKMYVMEYSNSRTLWGSCQMLHPRYGILRTAYREPRQWSVLSCLGTQLLREPEPGQSRGCERIKFPGRKWLHGVIA